MDQREWKIQAGAYGDMDKFFAFGSGPRLCMGKYIGVTMIKSAVANILFNFHVELVKGHHVYSNSSLILNMKNVVGAIARTRNLKLARLDNFEPQPTCARDFMKGLSRPKAIDLHVNQHHGRTKVVTYWPILGVLPCLAQNAHRMHDYCVDISNTHGLTKVLKGPFLEILYTCDPRNFEYITKTNFPNYPKGEEYNKAFEMLGDGLFNSDFDLWHGQRKLAGKAFASNNFSRMVSNLSKKVVEDELVPLLVKLIENSSTVDLEETFMNYTFDVAFFSIFGRNPKCLSKQSPENKFAKAMDDALEAIFFRHVAPPMWWRLCGRLKIGVEKKHHNAWETIDQSMAHYIALKKEELLQGAGQERSDILSTYIYLQNEKQEFTSGGDKFLRDSALTLLFAARDTTGASLSWFFYSVLSNPAVESKILDELKKVKKCNSENDITAKKPWIFNSEDVKGLVYLHAACCETLRLYPGLPLNRKEALHEDVLPDGTMVRPKMMIIMSPFAMARMKSLWGNDCMKFKPERWITEDGQLSNEPMDKFHTFGAGPRICIGKDFALTLLKSAAASLLFNFKFELVKGHKVYPKPSLVLQMKNGLLVQVKRRVF
ncbi:Cytochrome p450 [Thalictrum thalictroides]|uniref:Cytochrome p450 n=1 Tax=Thalictrum thalictroides TaxID=46969 RepID=A0A7J6VTP9_THATH|nr:Cytochrome p450 [Thalictrum thalictroides]